MTGRRKEEHRISERHETVYKMIMITFSCLFFNIKLNV